jgi:hypothetical protein
MQTETLRGEKAVLCTNISSLYKTARLEIERKDAEIKSLRELTRCGQHCKRGDLQACAL